MKKELQLIIITLKQKEEKAMREIDKFEDVPHMQGIAIGKARAFSSCIQWLTLLLNSENEKSSQSSQGHGSNSSNAM